MFLDKVYLLIFGVFFLFIIGGTLLYAILYPASDKYDDLKEPDLSDPESRRYHPLLDFCPENIFYTGDDD